MSALTRPQRSMLRGLLAGEYPAGDLLLDVASDARAEITQALAWRNADRTLSALCRRGLVAVDGDVVVITAAGREAYRGCCEVCR